MRLVSIFNTIRSRMWLVLSLLAGATMLVGLLAWFALNKADEDLNNFHAQTLSEVAKALSLSKRSSDLATSAPYLLNLRSGYLVNKEGQLLVSILEDIKEKWPVNDPINAPQNSFKLNISTSLELMRVAISDLILTSDKLNLALEDVLQTNKKLQELRDKISAKIQPNQLSQRENQNWLSMQAMTNSLIGAGFAENLLGVGEYRRNYNFQKLTIDEAELTSGQLGFIKELATITIGDNGKIGLFENRRRELSYNLEAQNALFRIRVNSNSISQQASEYASNVESFLSQKRNETISSITFAKTAIIAIGIISSLIAFISALYISGYVTNNMSLVSNAMSKLASGDRQTELPNKNNRDDEIGDLFRSFRIFRANALRLDRSNKQLFQRNALFEKVFNNISDGVAITDETGKLTAHNPNFLKILRLATPTSQNNNIINLLSQSHFRKSSDLKKLKSNFRGFFELASDDGQIVEVRSTRLPDEGRVWLFSDATERRRIEERLNQIRKIESLGKVTGEVAHDFGNVLSTISSNLYLLNTANTKTKLAGINQRISNAVEIGTSLTQRLLTFARKQHLTPEITELNSLIEGISDLILVGLKPEVTLNTKLPAKKLFVQVDPGQLESAILNLCLNSNQAIDPKGEIIISLSSTSNNTAVIEVKDNGAGMDEITQEQALEPFFTTRKDGNGTGLGLSMVYGFIKQTGGDMAIKSTKGKGTTVRLTLPLSKPAKKQKENQQINMSALLIEDDPIAMNATAILLEKEGFKVTKSSTFEKGESVIKNAEPYTLLVTDIELDNDKTGWELAKLALTKSSATYVIVASGRLPNTHPIAIKYKSRINCIAKPMTQTKLSKALNN